MNVSSQPRRFVAGVAVDMQPSAGWSIETAVLRRRFGYDLEARGITQVEAATTFLHRRGSGTVWEVPVVWKPRVAFGSARGFLGAGFAVRHVADVRWSEHSEFRGFLSAPRIEDHTSNDPPELNRRNAIGLVLSAGLEFRALRMRLSPEVRYTHWDSPRAGDNSSVRIQRDAVDVALNLSYVVRDRERHPLLRVRRMEPGVMVGIAPLAEFQLPAGNEYRGEKKLTAAGASLGSALDRKQSIDFSFLTREFAYRSGTSMYRGRIWEPAAIVRRAWRGWFAGAGLGLRRTSELSLREYEISWAKPAWGPVVQGGREWGLGAMRWRMEGRYHFWSKPLWDYTPYERGRRQSVYVLFGMRWVPANAGRDR